MSDQTTVKNPNESTPYALGAETQEQLPCGRNQPQDDQASVSRRLTIGEQKLKAHLQDKGLNFSEPRWNIAQVVLKSRRHFSAQDLVKAVQHEFPEIGTATIYRSIHFLIEAKILKETLIDQDRRVVYEAEDDGHHDHLVCVDCGAIFEFHSEALESAQEKVIRELSFQETSHRHVIYANCQKLAPSGSSREH